MEDGLRIAGIVLSVACALVFVGSTFYRRMVFSKYQFLLARQDFAGCVRLLNGFFSRLLLPGYNRLFMLLTAEQCLDDATAVRSIIDQMLKLRMTAEQRLALLLRGFNFFIDQKDYKRAKKLLVELREERTKTPAEALANCERTYDVFAHKSSAYIKEMRSQLKDAKGEVRMNLLYLLSVQYENNGEKDRAEACMAEIKAMLEGDEPVVEAASEEADSAYDASKDAPEDAPADVKEDAEEK